MRKKSLVLIATVGACLAFAATAAAGFRDYYSGITCCSIRHYGGYTYQTSNGAAGPAQFVVCVQELVFPNWPNRAGSFYDSPACGYGGASHGLNGQHVDQALCWIQSGGTNANLACSETYR